MGSSSNYRGGWKVSVFSAHRGIIGVSDLRVCELVPVRWLGEVTSMGLDGHNQSIKAFFHSLSSSSSTAGGEDCNLVTFCYFKETF